MQIPAECEIKIQNPNDSGLQLRVHDITFNQLRIFFLIGHQSIALPTARVKRVVEIETIDCLSHQPVQIIYPTPDEQPPALRFTFDLSKDGNDTTLFDEDSFSWSRSDLESTTPNLPTETDGSLEPNEPHEDDIETAVSTVSVPETTTTSTGGNSGEQYIENKQIDKTTTNTTNKQQEQNRTQWMPSCNLMICALGVLSLGMFTSLVFPQFLFGDLPCMNQIHPS